MLPRLLCACGVMIVGKVWVEATQPTVWSGVAPEGDNGTLKEHKK